MRIPLFHGLRVPQPKNRNRNFWRDPNPGARHRTEARPCQSGVSNLSAAEPLSEYRVIKVELGAKELYRRIENTAYIACTRANRVGPVPASSQSGCYEKALGDAVREAMAHGIELTAQMAAK